MALNLFGGDASDYYQGSQWQSDYGNNINYTPSTYNMFQSASYGGGMGTNMQNAINTQLSGQLSPAVQAQLSQMFQSNLQQAKAGSYGAPVSAQNYNTQQVAGNVALQGALLGEQQISQGESAGQSYLNAGQQENQFAGTLANNQSQFASNLALAKGEYAGNLEENAYNRANQDTGIFGDLISAGTSYGLSQLFPQKKTA